MIIGITAYICQNLTHLLGLGRYFYHFCVSCVFMSLTFFRARAYATYIFMWHRPNLFHQSIFKSVTNLYLVPSSIKQWFWNINLKMELPVLRRMFLQFHFNALKKIQMHISLLRRTFFLSILAPTTPRHWCCILTNTWRLCWESWAVVL